MVPNNVLRGRRSRRAAPISVNWPNTLACDVAAPVEDGDFVSQARLTEHKHGETGREGMVGSERERKDEVRATSWADGVSYIVAAGDVTAPYSGATAALCPNRRRQAGRSYVKPERESARPDAGQGPFPALR